MKHITTNQPVAKREIKYTYFPSEICFYIVYKDMTKKQERKTKGVSAGTEAPVIYSF